MVINFQSWSEPLIIISALPCALAGIIWMLFITGTTISVPASESAETLAGGGTGLSPVFSAPSLDEGSARHTLLATSNSDLEGSSGDFRIWLRWQNRIGVSPRHGTA
jgi:hypothetical protein